jgi:hypothetical protein
VRAASTTSFVVAALAMAALSVSGEVADDKPTSAARMGVQAIEPVPKKFSYAPKFRCARIAKFEPWGKSATTETLRSQCPSSLSLSLSQLPLDSRILREHNPPIIAQGRFAFTFCSDQLIPPSDEALGTHSDLLANPSEN